MNTFRPNQVTSRFVTSLAIGALALLPTEEYRVVGDLLGFTPQDKKEPRVLTPRDFEALRKAEEKRARKAAKKVSHATRQTAG